MTSVIKSLTFCLFSSAAFINLLLCHSIDDPHGTDEIDHKRGHTMKYTQDLVPCSPSMSIHWNLQGTDGLFSMIVANHCIEKHGFVRTRRHYQHKQHHQDSTSHRWFVQPSSVNTSHDIETFDRYQRYQPVTQTIKVYQQIVQRFTQYPVQRNR